MNTDQIDICGVAYGLRRLCEAASLHINVDCFLHAALGCRILEDMGVNAQCRVGYAAWRVGPGDGDVISHRPEVGAQYEQGAVPLHAWIEIPGEVLQGTIIVDFTTYQLRGKAAALDSLDGGKTNVEWAPDYLVARMDSASSFRDVAQGNAGQYYYEASADLSATLSARMLDFDPDDLSLLRMLISNPSMRVIGPNHRNANCAFG